MTAAAVLDTVALKRSLVRAESRRRQSAIALTLPLLLFLAVTLLVPIGALLVRAVDGVGGGSVFAPFEELADAGSVAVNGTRLALTTDSFVVKPIRFPGGSIGELAVNGTVNDLAVSGARPLALS